MLKVCVSLERYFKGYSSCSSVIMLFVYMKLRFSLSYRDLEELMSIRGGRVDHATLQRWVMKFSFLIDDRVRKRKRPVNGSWRMDETYIKLNGKWIYLYRAVDSHGNTVDFLLRARRDTDAARAFFKKAFKFNLLPKKVTLDKSGSNKAAIDSLNEDLEKGAQITIRQLKYLKNIVEQDHRFVKKRTRPMLGFKNFHSARATLSGIENIRMIQKGQIKGQTKNQNSFHNFQNLMA
jgi:putative transposase